MATITSNYTGNATLYPEDISEIFAYTVGQTAKEINEIDSELYDAICHLKTVADNPFNSEYFRVFYDVLSTVAQKLKDRDYLQ